MKHLISKEICKSVIDEALKTGGDFAVARMPVAHDTHDATILFSDTHVRHFESY